MRRNKDCLDEGFLFLAPVVANNPGVLNVSSAIGSMPQPPFFDIKRCTLKLYGTPPSIGMRDVDICNTIRCG